MGGWQWGKLKHRKPEDRKEMWTMSLLSLPKEMMPKLRVNNVQPFPDEEEGAVGPGRCVPGVLLQKTEQEMEMQAGADSG